MFKVVAIPGPAPWLSSASWLAVHVCGTCQSSPLGSSTSSSLTYSLGTKWGNDIADTIPDGELPWIETWAEKGEEKSGSNCERSLRPVADMSYMLPAPAATPRKHCKHYYSDLQMLVCLLSWAVTWSLLINVRVLYFHTNICTFRKQMKIISYSYH